MAGSLNKVIIIGNLGKDPEFRSTNDGKEIASFSLATTETWKDRSSGEKKEKTEWHRIVAYNENLVKLLKNYVKKGSKLYIEGSLQTRKWVDQAGVEKYTTEIVLQNYNSQLVLLDSKNSGQSTEHGNDPFADFNKNSKEKTSNNFDMDLDDEIPF